MFKVIKFPDTCILNAFCEFLQFNDGQEAPKRNVANSNNVEIASQIDF